LRGRQNATPARWRAWRAIRRVSAWLLQQEFRRAGEGLHADLAVALAVAVFEARSRAEAWLFDRGAGCAQVAAEAFRVHGGRQRFRGDDLDVAADRFDLDAAAFGKPDLQGRVPRDRAAGDLAQAFAAAVDRDVAGDGLGPDFAVQAAAQADAAADRVHFDVTGVQGELQVAADALDVGLARGTGDGDIATDAADFQAAAGGADDADPDRDAVDFQAGQRRHVDHQVGRFAGIAGLARIPHLDLELAAACADLELVHAAAEAAGDAHLRLVPGAYLDAALEVGDLDLAVGVERSGLVDRGRRQCRQRQRREQQGKEEAEGHGVAPVRKEGWRGVAKAPVAARTGVA